MTSAVQVKVAEVVEGSNTPFSRKGYRGPYLCLAQDCGATLRGRRPGHGPARLMVKHWTESHGDVAAMAFLDTASATAITVLAVCGHAAFCTSCPAVLHASRAADFTLVVATHWRNAHPGLATEHRVTRITPAMVSPSPAHPPRCPPSPLPPPPRWWRGRCIGTSELYACLFHTFCSEFHTHRP